MHASADSHKFWRESTEALSREDEVLISWDRFSFWPLARRKERMTTENWTDEWTNGTGGRTNEWDLGTRASLGRHVAAHAKNLSCSLAVMRLFIDLKIFLLLSLFTICIRCFNPLDDGQYDINWGGPVTHGEGQVSPVSMEMCSTRFQLICCV